MVSSAKTRKNKTPHGFVTGLGLGLIVMAGIILFRLFQDPIKQEIQYAVRSSQVQSSLTPPNTDFALVIDKIGAVSPIIAQVDPFNSQVYQLALREGVAHAQGTSLPGMGGNVFLFAHSSADLLTAERYNSVFYLIHHLEPGDQIKVWYLDQEYLYTVTSTDLVSPADTQYLTSQGEHETLMLMTCWPPGTTFKRLIVTAQLASRLPN